MSGKFKAAPARTNRAFASLGEPGPCPTGKIRYLTRRNGKDELKRSRGHFGSGCRVYRCECGFFHIGHLRPAVKAGLVDRAEAYGDAA